MLRKILLTAAAVVVGAVTAHADPIRVGVTAGPHAEILEVVKKVGAERGLDIRPIEFTDYVIPNQALADGDIEINSFQHEPYLINQISKTGWKLSKVALTIGSPMGFYSSKYKSFDEIPEGATIGIQNDPSNGARSLRLLGAGKVVTLKDPNSLNVSILDIAENPKKLKFVELDAAQLARSLPDVDAAAINNNYAVQAGLNPMKDTILSETLDTPYVNILAVRDADKDKPWVKQFIEVYHSEPVKQFVTDRFKGTYVATW